MVQQNKNILIPDDYTICRMYLAASAQSAPTITSNEVVQRAVWGSGVFMRESSYQYTTYFCFANFDDMLESSINNTSVVVHLQCINNLSLMQVFSDTTSASIDITDLFKALIFGDAVNTDGVYGTIPEYLHGAVPYSRVSIRSWDLEDQLAAGRCSCVFGFQRDNRFRRLIDLDSLNYFDCWYSSILLVWLAFIV